MPSPPATFLPTASALLRDRILPVIDILHRQAVRGRAGKRSEYRPLQSCWTNSTDPWDVAVALQRAFGFQSFYLADLDGILHSQPDFALYERFVAAGWKVWIDSGTTSVTDAIRLAELGVSNVIVGLESCPSPQVLEEIIQAITPAKTVFSLDLKSGAPLATADWPATVDGIWQAAINSGIERMIVLDLAAVGEGTGIPTLPLCRRIRSRHPAVQLVTGGGVSNWEDVTSSLEAGIDRILVASALHDGRIPGFNDGTIEP